MTKSGEPSSGSEDQPSVEQGQDQDEEPVALIEVYTQAPADYDGTCLRPLGLCELGGSCDACWYNSNREASIGQRPDAKPATDPDKRSRER